MENNCDILIVGGGLNGPALALALASGGFRSTIIDAQPVASFVDSDFDGRAYALALGTKNMLAAMGIWAGVEKFSQPILDVIASDGKAGQGAGPLFVHFDHQEIEEGPMGYMLEDRYLRRALLEAVAGNDLVASVNSRKVVAQATDDRGVCVTLDNGETLRAALLVGCDGRTSGTALRAGIARTQRGYDQTALVCAIRHDKPHNGAAHQFFMPSGPLGILPLPGNRSSIVWAEKTERATWIAGLSDEDYMDELRPCFGDFLGDIALEGARFRYPLTLSLANSLYAERLALVGDAAHGIHPLAGQGLNLGMRDVATLAEVLTLARRRGEDFTNAMVLERYAQWRRFDIATMAAATDGINRLFSNDNAILRAGRDIGLGLVNAVPSLKRGLIRQAAGLTGDLPKLMRGQAI